MKKPLNRLQFESSDYLKAHSANPVDWYPWGKEALGKAKRENKPIFLSIGYSACHWCHVMEKESFESIETAELMNKHFINIKVDREERQDLDHIYMTAVQLLTGRGGWPMSVFLTPELKPFYGGTYFPPEDKHGMPSFKKILAGVANAWATKPQEVLASSEQLFLSLSQMHLEEVKGTEALPTDLLNKSAEAILTNFDEQYGGFGTAPKFFHTMDMQVVLLHYSQTLNPRAKSLLEKTWSAWAQGGIYDHLGGGFHRYSTDQYWFAPHFEKMLYDNALVTSTYVEAFKLFKTPLYSQIASQTLDYVLREMVSDEGAFYSTQDADTEGEEGKFYVWKKSEITDVIGEEISNEFCKVYGVTEEGNWEHSNILHLQKNIETYAAEHKLDLVELEDTLALAKRKLLAARLKRPVPHKDEKIILSWNGMMIETMARASYALSNEEYLLAAKKAAEFSLKKLRNSDGLLHSFQEGKATLNAYLDDWANFIQSLITLFEVTAEEKWLKDALSLSQGMIENFYDDKNSDFYFTPKYHESLIFRPKETHDGATPAATAVALTALARLGRITSDQKILEKVERALLKFQEHLQKIPSAYAQTLLAYAYIQPSCKEVVLVPGLNEEENKMALHLLQESYLGTHVVIHPCPSLKDSLLLKGKISLDEKATVYMCQNRTCEEPWSGIEKITAKLSSLSSIKKI